jgi:integrase
MILSTRLGRAFGPGKLRRVQRGDGAPIWTFYWTEASGTRRQQAISTDKRVAEMRANEIIRSRDMALHGLGALDGQTRDLSEIIDAYVQDLATRVSAAHVLNSRQSLARMLDELRVRRVMDLRPYEVLQARARLLASGLAPRTANIHVDRLKAALNWATDAELIAGNPIAKLKSLPTSEGHSRKIRRAMSDDEIARFLAAAEADDRANEVRGWVPNRVPQAPFWRFLVETACRYGEARCLTWADVDLATRTVTLRAETTKTRRARPLPLPPFLAETLAQLREKRLRATGRAPLPVERVFLGPEGRALSKPSNNAMRVFDRLLEAAGIERQDAHGRSLDIHALRHTAATRLVRTGAPLAVTQRVLGHSDPKLTARVYTHLGAEDLRGAVERAAGQ